MPFTVAHTVLIIPIKWLWPRYVSLTGLMAGAMAPDLVYFLQLTTVSRGLGHSWTGLVMFCLPAGIAFAFAFHWLFKYNFIINLPSPFDKALSGLATTSFSVVGLRSWAVLVVSVLVGTLSHFFWDSLTHTGGEIARAVPFLSDNTIIIGVPVLNTLIVQQVSTTVGIVGLVFGLRKTRLLPSPQPGFAPRRTRNKLFFRVLLGAAAATFALMVVSIFSYFLLDYPVKRAAIFGISGWSGFFYPIAVYTIRQMVRSRAAILPNSR
ncbi:MAG: DUF4184 family protein [Candidatus Zixiibacteriota bacterium]|nr:MAG: DUF4184 family protein [candidate division Zixibacteria bacterium]